jgi:hypothetical protein
LLPRKYAFGENQFYKRFLVEKRVIEIQVVNPKNKLYEKIRVWF